MCVVVEAWRPGVGAGFGDPVSRVGFVTGEAGAEVGPFGEAGYDGVGLIGVNCLVKWKGGAYTGSMITSPLDSVALASIHFIRSVLLKEV